MDQEDGEISVSLPDEFKFLTIMYDKDGPRVEMDCDGISLVEAAWLLAKAQAVTCEAVDCLPVTIKMGGKTVWEEVVTVEDVEEVDEDDD